MLIYGRRGAGDDCGAVLSPNYEIINWRFNFEREINQVGAVLNENWSGGGIKVREVFRRLKFWWATILNVIL